MTNVTDSFSISKRLKSHQIPPEQADAIASEITAAQQVSFEKLASKDDLGKVKDEIKRMKDEIKRMKEEILQDVRVGLSEMRLDIAKWIMSLLIFGLYGLIILKLLL